MLLMSNYCGHFPITDYAVHLSHTCCKLMNEITECLQFMYNSDAMLEEDIGQPLRAKLMSESKSAVTLSSYCPVCS